MELPDVDGLVAGIRSSGLVWANGGRFIYTKQKTLGSVTPVFWTAHWILGGWG